MLMYSWMVWVEHAPERYDWAVKLMTAGKIDKIKSIIASKIEKGDRVLDIGCGTGTLGLKCVDQGATVYGIDISDSMLDECKKNIKKKGAENDFTIIKDSITDLRKHFDPASLDKIVSTMVVGELSKNYLKYIFRDCYDVLKPGGKVIIVDEVWPEQKLWSALYRVVMAIMWVPQFAILRRAFFPIKELSSSIQAGGFKIVEKKNWNFSTFQMIIGEKTNVDENKN